MFYETKIKYTVTDNKGRDKQVTERYICQDCEFFAEAEHKTLSEHEDCEVVTIHKSAVKEIVNDFDENKDIYVATITDTYEIDEKTSVMKYKVLLYASDLADANNVIHHYMQQGLQNMVCESIKKTQIIKVL